MDKFPYIINKSKEGVYILICEKFSLLLPQGLGSTLDKAKENLLDNAKIHFKNPELDQEALNKYFEFLNPNNIL